MSKLFNGATLLFIGGSVETLPAIRQAQSLGLFVVVSDLKVDAVGAQAADDSIVASTYDVSDTVRAVCSYHNNIRKIDAVLSVGCDVPRTVSAVATALSLVSVSPRTALACTDKFLMKSLLSDGQCQVPRFWLVESPEDLLNLCNAQDYSLILKPRDSRGSRGVLQLDSTPSLQEAFEISSEFSKHLILEEYISGPQFSTESVVHNGIVTTVGISRRNYEYLTTFAPYIIENGGDMPSGLSEHLISAIDDQLYLAAKALGIHNGIMKGDIVINNNRVYIIEVACRLSGGFFCTHMIPYSTGTNLIEIAIRQSFGLSLDTSIFRNSLDMPVSQRYLFPPPGCLKAIDGFPEAFHMPGILDIIITAQDGDFFGSPTNSNSSAAMVLATGSSVQNAIFNASNAVQVLKPILY